MECTVRPNPPPPPADADPSIFWQFQGYGFIDYHVAAVFQLNDGGELTTGFYQDAFTQQPLALVNIVAVPGSDGRTENIAVFGDNFNPVAPPGENFIVPEGIACQNADDAGAVADPITAAIAAFPFLNKATLPASAN